MKQEERCGRAKHHAVMLLLFGFIISTATSRLHAEETMSLTLNSTAFTHGEAIPVKHTCQAEDLSPPLRWEGVSENAKSLVLIVDDPDAPDPKAPKTVKRMTARKPPKPLSRALKFSISPTVREPICRL